MGRGSGLLIGRFGGLHGTYEDGEEEEHGMRRWERLREGVGWGDMEEIRETGVWGYHLHCFAYDTTVLLGWLLHISSVETFQ